VVQSQLIGQLKNSLSDAEARQTEIVSTLGKNHPDYKAAEAEVATLKARIAEETEKIVASLGNANQVNVRRETDIQAALEAQKKKVLELKHEHDQAAILESEVANAQKDLDLVSDRYAQSSLESQARQTNVALLTTATEPNEPSSPKLLINILVGIFLGAIVGIGSVLLLEFANPVVRCEADLHELLGVPLLVKIRSVGA
jgi:uncharacterized protein involved in exopolysaccharide biosynthesis